jgi:hypothetical protein
MATYIANRNFPCNKLYQMHIMPVLLDCNFVVDSTNGNGLGLRSLKGGGIHNVFMHTSATPGMGNGGIINPNPPAGYIIVQLQDNYNRYISGFAGAIAPVSGTPLTSVTSGTVYIITSVGTGTQAQWAAIGLPAGDAPSVGAAFLASASTTVPGGGTVETPSVTGITTIEVVGDPNQTIAPVGVSRIQGVGAQFMIRCLAPTSSSVTTAIPTNPANGSTVSLAFYLNNSGTSAGSSG